MNIKNSFFKQNNIYMGVILLLVVILFLYKHFIVGSIVSFIYILLIVYNVRSASVRKKEWKAFVEDFSSKLDDATKNILIRFPFPLVIIEDTGNVIWYNKGFSNINKEEVLNKNIKEFIPGINLKQILEEDVITLKGIKFGEKYYDLFVNNITSSNDNKGNILVIYFYDVSEAIYLTREMKNNKEGILLIEIDNLDDVIKTTKEDKRPLLIAEIERTINSYSQKLSGAIKKYSNNKYILITQNKFIDKEIENKFSILDEIREINVENTLSATLSIGVGMNGNNPSENEDLANYAKELALGRGGDQAIVKSPNQLSFFGGNTKEMEKRTKVRARVVAHALLNIINESSNVFIMGHKKPDIDCLGAAVGIYSATKNLNKDCQIVLEDVNSSVNSMLDRLREEGYKNAFINYSECIEQIDDNSLLIIVDVHSKNYVENYNIVKACKRIVLVDHHRKSSDAIEGALLNYIEPYASSTSELVTEMIQYMFDKPKLKPVEAEALLAGICIDTKNFYFKTGVRTFEAASFLRRLGADTIDIKKLFSDDLNTYLNRAEIIKSAEVVNEIAIAMCPINIKNTLLAAQAADELLNITGIEASFVLIKEDNDVNISGRSLGNVNVQRILEDLGGGGHMTMAGAKLKDIDLTEAKLKLKQVIDKYLMEGEE